MKTSLFFKNFTVYAMLILLSFAFIGGIFLYQVNRYAVGEIRKNLNETTGRAADTTRIFLENYSPSMEMIYKLNLTQSASLSGGVITVSSADGKVAYYADKKGCIIPDKAVVGADIVKTVISGGRYSELGNLGGFFSEYYYSNAAPIHLSSGETVGMVVVSVPAGATVKLFSDLAQIFLWVTICALFLTLIISYFVARRQTRPLKIMAAASKHFARGDFSVRVPVDVRCNEIAECAVSFNNMAASLQNLDEMRNDFIANVSHDLKTPMTTISGFVDGILDGTIPQDEQGRYLAIISDEVKRLSRLSGRMLNTVRLESGQMVLRKSSFDICEMASRIILNFEKAINERGIGVEVSIPDELTLSADRDTIFQALYNLIDNAVKYTNEGGRITMGITLAGPRMFFEITNTGNGISMDDLPYIFDRFYKADRSRSRNPESSGVGLYIAKTAVNLHGGDIYAESAPDGTVTVRFDLPLA